MERVLLHLFNLSLYDVILSAAKTLGKYPKLRKRIIIISLPFVSIALITIVVNILAFNMNNIRDASLNESVMRVLTRAKSMY